MRFCAIFGHPAGSKTGCEKRGEWPQSDVLAEIERERAAFARGSRKCLRSLIYRHYIEGNYADAVRLLDDGRA